MSNNNTPKHSQIQKPSIFIQNFDQISKNLDIQDDNNLQDYNNNADNKNEEGINFFNSQKKKETIEKPKKKMFFNINEIIEKIQSTKKTNNDKFKELAEVYYIRFLEKKNKIKRQPAINDIDKITTNHQMIPLNENDKETVLELILNKIEEQKKEKSYMIVNGLNSNPSRDFKQSNFINRKSTLQSLNENRLNLHGLEKSNRNIASYSKETTPINRDKRDTDTKRSFKSGKISSRNKKRSSQIALTSLINFIPKKFCIPKTLEYDTKTNVKKKPNEYSPFEVFAQYMLRKSNTLLDKKIENKTKDNWQEIDIGNYKKKSRRTNSNFFPFSMQNRRVNDMSSVDSNNSILESEQLGKKELPNSTLLERNSTNVRNNIALSQISDSVKSQQVKLKQFLDRNNGRIDSLQYKVPKQYLGKYKKNYTSFKNSNLSNYVLKKIQHKDMGPKDFYQTNGFIKQIFSNGTTPFNSNQPSLRKNEGSFTQTNFNRSIVRKETPEGSRNLKNRPKFYSSAEQNNDSIVDYDNEKVDNILNQYKQRLNSMDPNQDNSYNQLKPHQYNKNQPKNYSNFTQQNHLAEHLNRDINISQNDIQPLRKNLSKTNNFSNSKENKKLESQILDYRRKTQNHWTLLAQSSKKLPNNNCNNKFLSQSYFVKPRDTI